MVGIASLAEEEGEEHGRMQERAGCETEERGDQGAMKETKVVRESRGRQGQGKHQEAEYSTMVGARTVVRQSEGTRPQRTRRKVERRVGKYRTMVAAWVKVKEASNGQEVKVKEATMRGLGLLGAKILEGMNGVNFVNEWSKLEIAVDSGASETAKICSLM